MTSLIVAMARNRVIGKDNALPWRIPEDWAYFKKTTLGHPVIMGRKTFESLGHPLKGRENIVVTRNPHFQAQGVEIVLNLEEALRLHPGKENFIIGGSEIYTLALPLVDTVYLTLIEKDFEGDAFFPDMGDDFELVGESERFVSKETQTPYKFLTYKRKRKK